MLKRIRIRNYKSLVDLDLTLQPLSVLLGPNSAGKSNFLDALQLLSGMAVSSTLKEAFEPPYRGTPLQSSSFGFPTVKEMFPERQRSFSFEIDVELSRNVVEKVNRQIREMRSTKDPDETDEDAAKASVTRRYLRYRVEVEVSTSSGMLRVLDEYLAALNPKGEPLSKPLPFIERKLSGSKPRLHLRMEGQAHPTYYETHLDHTILSRPLYPPHYPHLVAMRQELASWLAFYFEPRERMRERNPVKEVHHIGLMGENLAAYLNTLKSLDQAQFNALQKSMQMIIPSISGIDVSLNSLGEVELGFREGEHTVPARIASEGTLRILGLLALGGVKDPPALIGFEEPENGVHPRRIKLIAELLQNMTRSGETQLIVTTHSPVLADLIPNESLFVCRKEKGHTNIAPLSSWGSLDRDDAIDRGLEDDFPTPLSERLLRGDLDA